MIPVLRLQASKDLSSVPMFVRVTRGPHVVESAAVLSRSLSSDDVGDGDGGRHIGDAKDSSARSWSWRWDETLELPGSVTAAESGARSSRTSFRSVGLDADGEQKARGENQRGSEDLSYPLSAAATDNNEGRHASTGDNNANDTKGGGALYAGESPSTTIDGAAGATAQGGVQGNVISPRGSDASCSDDNVYSVADTMYDFTEECKERTSPTNLIEIEDKIEGGAAVIAQVTAPEPSVGARKTRGVSFWSPKKGNRSNGANTDTSVLEKRGKDGGPSKENPGKEALTAETHVAVATADEKLGDGSSSSDFDPSGVNAEQEETGRKLDSADSTSSDESCTEASVKVSDTVAGEGADVGDSAPTEVNSDVARKRGVSFWSPRKGRGKKSDTVTLAKQSSDVDSNWNSEASTAFDIDGEGGSDAGETDDVVPGGERINGSSSPERWRKRGRGVFWSQRKDGNVRSKKKAGDSDGNKKGGGAGVDRHASDGHGAAATKRPHVSAHTTTRKAKTYEKFRRRRSRAPLKVRASPDALLVEVWQVNGSAALRPTPMERGVSVAKLGCNGLEGGVGSTRHVNLEETGMTDAASDRSDSGEKAPSLGSSEYERNIAAATVVGTGRESPPANRGILHTSGATLGQGGDSVEAQQGYADEDHPKVMGDELSAVGDESSVASAVSTKKSRPRKSNVFSSPFKGRRAKNKGRLKLPASGSPVTPSEPETPRNSQPAMEEGDDDHPQPPAEEEGGQQGADSLDGNGENVPETNGTSDEDVGDEDDDASILSQVPIASELSVVVEMPEKNARKQMFSSPTKDKKKNNKSVLPFGWHRSDSELLDKPPENGVEIRPLLNRGKPGKDRKPTLWGRLTIPVTDVLFTARGMCVDVMDDECWVSGQHVLRKGTSIKNFGDSECLPDRSSTGDNMKGSSSVSGMSLPRLGLKNKAAGKGVDTVGGTPVTLRVTEMASESLTQPSPTSTVESWFEVGHPKGKKGKKARGRMRLTLSYSADGDPCSPENIP